MAKTWYEQALDEQKKTEKKVDTGFQYPENYKELMQYTAPPKKKSVFEKIGEKLGLPEIGIEPRPELADIAVPDYMKDVAATDAIPTPEKVTAIKQSYDLLRKEAKMPPMNETLGTMSRIDWAAATDDQIEAAFRPFGMSRKDLGLPDNEMEQAVNQALDSFMNQLGLTPSTTGLPTLTELGAGQVKTPAELEELYVNAYKRATVPELGEDAPWAKRVESRMRGTAFDVASFGAGAKKEALPSSGSKIFDFVLDTAGSIAGAMASGNVLGAGTSVYGAINQYLGRNVAAKTAATVGTPDVFSSRVATWTQNVLPEMVAGGADLTAITASRLLMTGEINELSGEDQIKLLGTSFLQGAIFGAITGTIKPYAEASKLKKQGFAELKMRDESGKLHPTGVWMKGDLVVAPDGGVWVGKEQVGTSLSEYLRQNQKVSATTYIQSVDQRNVVGRKGLYMSIYPEVAGVTGVPAVTPQEARRAQEAIRRPMLQREPSPEPVPERAMVQPTAPVPVKPKPVTEQLPVTAPTGKVIPQPGPTEPIELLGKKIVRGIEEGKKITLYHGSDAKIDILKPSTAQAGHGIFLTDSSENAKEYGSKTYEVEINPNKIATESDFADARETLLADIQKKIDMWDKRLDPDLPNGEYDYIQGIIEKFEIEYSNIEDGLIASGNKRVTDLLKNRGFDALVGDMQSGEAGLEVVVLDPEIITRTDIIEPEEDWMTFPKPPIELPPDNSPIREMAGAIWEVIGNIDQGYETEVSARKYLIDEIETFLKNKPENATELVLYAKDFLKASNYPNLINFDAGPIRSLISKTIAISHVKPVDAPDKSPITRTAKKSKYAMTRTGDGKLAVTKTTSAYGLGDVFVRKFYVSPEDEVEILKNWSKRNDPKKKAVAEHLFKPKFKPESIIDNQLEIDKEIDFRTGPITAFVNVTNSNLYGMHKDLVSLYESFRGTTVITTDGAGNYYIAKIDHSTNRIIAAFPAESMSANDVHKDDGLQAVETRKKTRAAAKEKLGSKYMPFPTVERNIGMLTYGVERKGKLPGMNVSTNIVQGNKNYYGFGIVDGLLGYHMYNSKNQKIGFTFDEAEARKMLYLSEKKGFIPEEKTIKLKSTSDFQRHYDSLLAEIPKKDGVGGKEVLASTQALDMLYQDIDLMPVFSYKTGEGDIYRGKVTYLNLVKKMIYEGKIDVSGMEFFSEEDLAAKLMVFRNPMFETFRVLYAKDGKIITVDSNSARLPSEAPVPISEDSGLVNMVEKATSLGADEIIMMHNHPTGKVKQSRGDINTHNTINNRLRKIKADIGVKIKTDRHIIIDHNKYNVLIYTAGGVLTEEKSIKNPIFTEDLIKKEIVNVYGKDFNGITTRDPFLVAKTFYTSPDVFSVAYTDVQNKVIAVEEFGMEILENQILLGNHIDKMSKYYGAMRPLIFTPAVTEKQSGFVKELQKKGRIVGGIEYRAIGKPITSLESEKVERRLTAPLKKGKGTTLVYEEGEGYVITDEFMNDYALDSYDNQNVLKKDLAIITEGLDRAGMDVDDLIDWVENYPEEKPYWFVELMDYVGDEARYAIERVNQIVSNEYNPSDWDADGYPTQITDYNDLTPELEDEIFLWFPEAESLDATVGWILPSGRMVDFGEGQGYRTLDHRSISRALSGVNIGSEWSDGMRWVLDHGAARYFPEGNGVNVTGPLTQGQKLAMYDMIEMNDGEVFVFLSKPDQPGTSADEHEFPTGTTPDEFYDAIEQYYETGELQTFSVGEAGQEYNADKNVKPKWYKRKEGAIEREAERLKKSVDKAVFDTQSVEKTDAAIDKQARERINDLDRYARERERVKQVRGEEREKARQRMQDLKLKQKAKADAAKQKKLQIEAQKKLLRSVKRLDKIMQKFKLPLEVEQAATEIVYGIDTAALNVTRRTVERTEALKAAVESLQKTVPYYQPDKNVIEKIERLGKTQIGTMSPEEVADIQDVVNHIIGVALDAKTIKRGEERITISSVVNSFIQSNKIEPKPVDPSADILPAGKVNPLTKTFNALGQELFTVGNLAPRVEMLKLSNFDKASLFYDYMYNRMNDGGKKVLEFTRDASLFFNEKNNFSTIDGIKTGNWFGDRAPREKIQLPSGRSMSLTKGERISIYLHSLNAQNRKHLIEGGFHFAGEKGPQLHRLDLYDLKAINDSMTGQELHVARMMHKYFNEMSKNALNTASLETVYYEVAKVDNYFPIVTSDYYRKANYDFYNLDASLQGMGILKERVDSSVPLVLVNAIDQLQMSIGQVSKYYGFAKPIKDVKSIMNYQTEGGERFMRLAVERYYSEKDWKYLEKLIHDIEGGFKPKSAIEAGLGKLTRQAQASILAYNVPIIFNQLASIPYAAARIEPEYLAKAMGRKANWEEWVKRSGVVWVRTIGAFSREAKEAQDVGDIVKAITKYGLKGIKFADLAAINVQLVAAELKAKDQGLTGENFWNKAVEIAETMIQDTQPNYTQMQRTEHGRSQAIAVRWLGMFRTAVDQAYNLLYESTGVLRRKDDLPKSQSEEAVRAILGVAAGNALIAIFKTIKDKLRGREDTLTQNMIASFTGLLYGVSQISSYFVSGYGIEALPLQYINRLLAATKTLANPQSKKSAFARIYGFIEALGSISGVPVYNMNRIIKSIIGLIDPDARKDYEKLFK